MTKLNLGHKLLDGKNLNHIARTKLEKETYEKEKPTYTWRIRSYCFNSVLIFEM